MFKMKLKIYKINKKLTKNKQETLTSHIYDNVMEYFYNGNNDYVISSSYDQESNCDIEGVVQLLRNNWTPVNPVHIHTLFEDVYEYLTFKFLIYRNVYIERLEVNGVKFLKISYKK